MVKPVKITLIILLTLFILAGVLAAVGYFGWNKFSNLIEEEFKAGEIFGKGKNVDICLIESLKRLKNCEGLTCEVQAQGFYDTCIRISRKPPGFCDDFPSRESSLKIRIRLCKNKGYPDDPACIKLAGEVQKYCERLEKKST